MKRLARALLGAIPLLVAACASNHYVPAYKIGARYDAYEHYKPSIEDLAKMRASRNAELTKTDYQIGFTVADIDVVNYADHVHGIFVSKFTGSRFARYSSATTQVLLAGGAGVAAAFSAGTSVIAGLAFGSAVTPEIGKIFNAKGRAGYYVQAVGDIDSALNEYWDENGGTPSATTLTPAGRKLRKKVIAAINSVEIKMSDDLPDLKTSEQTKADIKAMQEQLADLNASVNKLREQLRATPPPTPSPSPGPVPPPLPSNSQIRADIIASVAKLGSANAPEFRTILVDNGLDPETLPGEDYASKLADIYKIRPDLQPAIAKAVAGLPR